jgi:hypothetical protein
MQHLSPERFEKAVNFIKQRGRPLEQAMVAHMFENAHLDTVLEALAKYQNPDGGFGHALEPDVRTPDSSVIATTIALQYLRDLRVPTVHPLWHGAMKFLSATYDHEKHLWWSVPADVSKAAHAPWWNPADPGGGSLTLNPRAEIVGYLFDVHDLPEYLPSSLRETLLEQVVHELESRPNELERHELQCVVRLVEVEDLPADWRERIMRVVHTAASGAVSRHPDEWAGYTLTPLDVVSSPKSLLYQKYADVIPANIDFIVAQQHSEGYWSPTWSWSDSRVSWAEVENDLRSLLTGHYLELLRRFDAIDLPGDAGSPN